MKLLRWFGRLLRALAVRLRRLGKRSLKLTALGLGAFALLFALDMLLNPSEDPRRP